MGVDDYDFVLMFYLNLYEFGGGDWVCVYFCAMVEVMKFLFRDFNFSFTSRVYVDVWFCYVVWEVMLWLNDVDWKF